MSHSSSVGEQSSATAHPIPYFTAPSTSWSCNAPISKPRTRDAQKERSNQK